MFDLAGVLRRITDTLSSESIACELDGGLAVLVHVEAADPEHSTLTRDVDLMVYRTDLEGIHAVAARNGFRFRHFDGENMLLYAETESARNAVHLIFSGEKERPNQATANPPIVPETMSILGKAANIIPVADLVRMKLSSFRDKDRVHVRSMDAAGLITPQVEQALPAELQTRLQHVRDTE
ncbi:MAG: hypothetical protein ACLQVD_12885 [Capsulimonadaceae bacterium]